VSVRPRLRTVGRGASIAGDGRGGAAGPGYENTISSQLSVAKPVPLRPPLVTCLPTALIGVAMGGYLFKKCIISHLSGWFLKI
jgi:hypothetical protein